MPFDEFSRRVAQAREQAATLRRRAAAVTGEDGGARAAVLEEALADMEVWLEELLVSEEELHQQFEALTQARLDLEAERQRYQALFEFAPDGYLVTNTDGVMTAANQAAYALLRVPDTRLDGRLLVSYVALEDRPAFRAHLRAAATERRSAQWEARLQPRQGPAFAAELKLAPIKAETGQVAGLLWLVRDVSERRRLQQQLEQALEDERTRIAREVHDELGAELTVLKMAMARLAQEPELPQAERQAHVQKMLKHTDRIVALGRRIAGELRPLALDELGLAAALEAQCEEFEQRTGIYCELNIEGDEPAAHPAVNSALVRALREALTNVARHAQARQVTVTLVQAPNQLTLTVQDNGVGFAAANWDFSKTLGVVGMRERLRDVGGSVNIRSVPGQGTTVVLSAPLALPGAPPG